MVVMDPSESSVSLGDDLLRRIWGHPSCVLLIFAGSSAEFAVNPAAEWLFYTGRLPADPIERFIGTVRYSRALVFASTREGYRRTVDDIRAIHTHLERARGRPISATAYLDVLFMNIEYSIRSFPLVFGTQLSHEAKDSVVASFRHMADLMKIPNAPADYDSYVRVRQERLRALAHSVWTDRLMASYGRALGPLGYFVLITVYGALVEPVVLSELGITRSWFSRLFSKVYPLAGRTGGDRILFALFLPRRLRRALLDPGLPVGNHRRGGLRHEL